MNTQVQRFNFGGYSNAKKNFNFFSMQGDAIFS